MKKVLALTLLASALCLSGCTGIIRKIISSDDSGNGSGHIDVVGEKVDTTIMIYLCGSDLESGYDGSSTDVNNAGYASLDINEILSVSGQPDDVNIIIQTGGARAWKNKSISSTKLGRWHIKNKKLIKDEELTYAAMGSTSTFQSFLEWGLSKYPADKTGVILWNHGGAMRGVCYDETAKGKNNPLLNSEVNAALKNAFKRLGRTEKLEWIGYDACLMQMQDVAEFNSPYFNYMITSQESEAGFGWDYDTWIDDVYAKKDTRTILKSICDGFIKAYDDTYGPYGYDNDQTLSYLDLSKMDAYKKKFESLAAAVKVDATASGIRSMAKKVKEYGTAYYESQSDLYEAGYDLNPGEENYYGSYGIVYENGYYVDHGYNYFASFDVVDFLDNLSTKYSALSSKVNETKQALNELVVYKKNGAAAGNSNGLSLYFPLHTMCEKEKYYSEAETNFSSWRSVVNSFGE